MAIKFKRLLALSAALSVGFIIIAPFLIECELMLKQKAPEFRSDRMVENFFLASDMVILYWIFGLVLFSLYIAAVLSAKYAVKFIKSKKGADEGAQKLEDNSQK